MLYYTIEIEFSKDIMQEKIDWLVEHDDELMTADGFDFALIGICERAGQPTIATYDTSKC